MFLNLSIQLVGVRVQETTAFGNRLIGLSSVCILFRLVYYWCKACKLKAVIATIRCTLKLCSHYCATPVRHDAVCVKIMVQHAVRVKRKR